MQLFNKMLAKKRSGFTMIELTIVMIILAILIGGGIYAMNAQSDNAKNTITVQDLDLLGGACGQYAAFSKDGKPPVSLYDVVTGVTATNSVTGKASGPLVANSKWTSAATMVDGWGTAFTYDASARTITSAGNGTPIVKSF
ncbi:MAG: type II secretion system protein [Patescibacteria group bacterium]|jgi:prepilin-type N-terminal cleavage/methylation domain-containing protein